MVACALGHPVVVDLLLHRGADPSIKDSTQSTALNAACLSGRTDIVKLFLLNQNLKLNNIQESHVWLGSAAFSGSLELVKFFLEEIGFKLDNSSGEHRSPLVQAAGQGHAQIVQYLIDKEADINSQGNPGKTTALIGACEMGQMETARMLIENGASLELVAVNGLNAIQSACLNGQQQVLKYLVNQGADWRVKLEEDGSTLLHLACQSESHAILETCQYLVEKLELNVNARDKQGATPLILGVATKKGKELIELFIEQGADLEVVSKYGMTAVMEASATGQLEIHKLLVAHGAKIGGDGCSQDYHPFIQAVRFGKLEVIKYFISEHKVDLDMVVNGGLTALMVAITEEQFEMAKQLIEAACDVNIISDSKDTALTLTVRAEAEHLGLLSLLIDSGANMEHRIYHENMTALLIAVKDNKYDTAKLLLEKGCNVNASDSTGATSLMYALLDQDLEIVKQLMRHGARQMVNQSMQLTALMIASALDNSDIVRYLLEQNGNVHARNPEGWTALMFATKAGKTANAKLLIRHKANVDSRDKGRETALVKACVKGKLLYRTKNMF